MKITPLILGGIFVLIPCSSHAAITAASTSLADVQAAINAATAGETVNIPAGTATWGTSGTSLYVNKAITLTGAGQDLTTIDISSTAASWTSGIISISAAATIKSLTIRTPTSGGSGTAFSAYADGFRITDVKFLGRTTSINGYFLYAGSYGLIDNCTITGGSGENELIFLRGPSDSWQTDSTMGGAGNFFIEDCTFGGQGYVTDCNSNSRCVVRFCTITGPMKIDGHGKFSNTPPRGVRHMEIYNNTWTGDGYWAAMELRGGTGRAFNNSAPNTSIVWLILNEYYVVNGGLTAANYPIDDQLGTGKDPKTAAAEPYYLWGNRRSTANWIPSLSYGTDMTGVINANRDYYNEVSPFNGSAGVGIGTKTQMLALTPTKTGVGFWVTDEGSWRSGYAGTSGQLYLWNGSAWTLNYTPYTYPHPLRGGGSTDTTAPSVPSNLSGAAASTTQINLTWTASTDNIAVTGYGVYRNGTLTSPTTATTYSDTGLAAGTTYSYAVNAYDAANNVSAKTASVNIATADLAPAITTQPVSLTTVATGASFTLSVTATGTNLQYQWRKDGSNLSGAANSSSYTVANMTSATAGSYTVAISNSAGSVTSNNAVVNLQGSSSSSSSSGSSSSSSGSSSSSSSSSSSGGPSSSGSGGGSGGGAPSSWFIIAMSMIALVRSTAYTIRRRG